EVAHPPSLVLALFHASSTHYFRGDWQSAEAFAGDSARLCIEQGFASLLGQANAHLGRAMAGRGQREEGISLMQRGLAAMRGVGAVLYQPYFLSGLAWSCYKACRTADGLNAVAEAQAIIEKTAEHLFDAELWRLKGELLLQAGLQDHQTEAQQS